MSKVVDEMFGDLVVGLMRIKDGRTLFRKEYRSHPEATRELYDRATAMTQGNGLRALLVEFRVSLDLVGIARFLGDECILAVCQRPDRLETRQRLEQFEESELPHFGSGLSLADSEVLDFVQDAPGSDVCTAARVAAFLNDSFDLIFARDTRSLRVAYARSFATHFTFLRADNDQLVATDELHVPTDDESKKLQHQFERVIRARNKERFFRDGAPYPVAPWATATRQRVQHAS